jgi:hypothetical protein
MADEPPLGGLEPVNRYRSAEAQLAQARSAIVAAQEAARAALALALREYQNLVSFLSCQKTAISLQSWMF